MERAIGGGTVHTKALGPLAGHGSSRRHRPVLKRSKQYLGHLLEARYRNLCRQGGALQMRQRHSTGSRTEDLQVKGNDVFIGVMFPSLISSIRPCGQADENADRSDPGGYRFSPEDDRRAASISRSARALGVWDTCGCRPGGLGWSASRGHRLWRTMLSGPLGAGKQPLSKLAAEVRAFVYG